MMRATTRDIITEKLNEITKLCDEITSCDDMDDEYAQVCRDLVFKVVLCIQKLAERASRLNMGERD